MSQPGSPASDEVRTIDVGALPERYARGWHCLGLLDAFKDGQPHEIKAFGTKLVIFTGESGQISVLDAYCRHMGGDLTQGTVKGDAIACPFHDWRWNGAGKCVGIPYAKRVPLRARTRAWTTMERNGMLFLWHDPEGNAPRPEDDIPVIETVGHDDWSDWIWTTLPVHGSNCREIIDNVADMAHFYYVHFAFPTYFKNIFEGQVATQYMESRGRPDIGAGSQYAGDDNTLKSEASYFGPSYMINWLWNVFKGTTIESILINCHYPIDQDNFMLQYAVMTKKMPGIEDRATANKIANSFAKSFKSGFEQDVAIWLNKSRIDNPLLSEEDGPVYQLRRWYQQFYVDRADVSEDMTSRFEFEIDTAHAVESWEAEVAENLRKRAEEEAAAQPNPAEAGVS
jgi:3-ketosteroid 9alpha-monooxygenase subunit A